MSDTFNKSDIKGYSADYRDVYIKGEGQANKIKGYTMELSKIKGNRGINEERGDGDSYYSKEEREKDEILWEIFHLIKVSFRMLATVFIILLCIGLVGLTVYLLNNDMSEIEKNHLPYTLLCMLRGDENKNID